MSLPLWKHLWLPSWLKEGAHEFLPCKQYPFLGRSRSPSFLLHCLVQLGAPGYPPPRHCSETLRCWLNARTSDAPGGSSESLNFTSLDGLLWWSVVNIKCGITEGKYTKNRSRYECCLLHQLITATICPSRCVVSGIFLSNRKALTVI